MRNLKLWMSSAPAPRKERVLPVSDPANAAGRELEAAATSSNGGADCSGQAATVSESWAAESTRLRALGMVAAGEGSTPVRRNRFYKNRGDGKRTNNVCTPRRLNRHSGKTEAMKDRQCPRDGPYGAAKYEPACGGQVMAIRRHKEFAWIRKRNKRSRMPFSEC